MGVWVCVDVMLSSEKFYLFNSGLPLKWGQPVSEAGSQPIAIVFQLSLIVLFIIMLKMTVWRSMFVLISFVNYWLRNNSKMYTNIIYQIYHSRPVELQMQCWIVLNKFALLFAINSILIPFISWVYFLVFQFWIFFFVHHFLIDVCTGKETTTTIHFGINCQWWIENYKCFSKYINAISFFFLLRFLLPIPLIWLKNSPAWNGNTLGTEKKFFLAVFNVCVSVWNSMEL